MERDGHIVHFACDQLATCNNSKTWTVTYAPNVYNGPDHSYTRPGAKTVICLHPSQHDTAVVFKGNVLWATSLAVEFLVSGSVCMLDRADDGKITYSCLYEGDVPCTIDGHGLLSVKLSDQDINEFIRDLSEYGWTERVIKAG